MLAFLDLFLLQLEGERRYRQEPAKLPKACVLSGLTNVPGLVVVTTYFHPPVPWIQEGDEWNEKVWLRVE